MKKTRLLINGYGRIGRVLHRIILGDPKSPLVVVGVNSRADAGVSSLSAETGRRIVVDEVMPYAEKHLAEALGAQAFDLPEEDLFRR